MSFSNNDRITTSSQINLKGTKAEERFTVAKNISKDMCDFPS
jgi:hypothetical protein